MFGHVPKTLWEHWMKPDLKNRICLACRSLFVQTEDGRNIIFEAGIGTFFEPKLRERYGIFPEEHMLLRNLENDEIDENDIDAIVLSHLHFDHAGGILSPYEDGPQRLLFPKAKIYVGKRNWEFAKKPHFREAASYIPHLNELLEKSGRLVLIDGDHHPDLDFGVSFMYSEGHTVGLMMSVFDLDTGPMVFVSDLIPGAAWVHLPVVMGYDRSSEAKCNEKMNLYEWLLGRQGSVFFTHDPIISHGKLVKDSQGRYSIQ
jgi:glyoxylase-like metal-dependent hydrolase (beta-lactamase superfamily II)